SLRSRALLPEIFPGPHTTPEVVRTSEQWKSSADSAAAFDVCLVMYLTIISAGTVVMARIAKPQPPKLCTNNGDMSGPTPRPISEMRPNQPNTIPGLSVLMVGSIARIMTYAIPRVIIMQMKTPENNSNEYANGIDIRTADRIKSTLPSPAKGRSR